MPLRARKTERALDRQKWIQNRLRDVLPVLEREFTPISDVRGSASYRQQLITTLLRKFFAR